MKTQGEGDHLQDVERGFRMEITLDDSRNKLLLFEPPNLWYVIMAAHATNTYKFSKILPIMGGLFLFYFFWLGNTVSVLEGYFKIVPVKKNPNFDIVSLFKTSVLHMKRSTDSAILTWWSLNIFL